MGADDRKFTGPYKGVVVSNVDPYNYGRLLVRVEDVLGSDPCIWADPAPPLAGLAICHSGPDAPRRRPCRAV